MTANMPQLEVLFHEALARTDAERAAYLDSACGGNSELRKHVENLLAANAERGNFLGGVGDVTQARPEGKFGVGGQIAERYKLLEVIGEGGMGTVYMAEQTTPVRRLVALKVIKPGMDSKAVLARFEAERQALALMDHPNIAKVLDAGATEDGRPFFVMELVKGAPITKFCDERKLSPRQRLELFVPVCQAIQHAHQKGVIHRDIKPSNVLVALYDGNPVPKVIDFGIAKATGQPLTERTLHTGFGAIVGTPEYMSPEQATFNQLDIDTRSDVYGLGILLYELLTGTTPVDKARLKEAAILELLRIVREDEPPRPSVKLTTADTRASIAATRGTEPDKLSKLLRGELDWIVMKALEKDRNRRYDTAAGLAKDVQRYLADEMVEARPPSTGYRLRKFLWKNRGPVILAATLVPLWMSLTAMLWLQWRNAENSMQGWVAANEQVKKEREEANRQYYIAREEKARAEANEKAAKAAAEEARQEKARAERSEKEAKATVDEAFRMMSMFRVTLLGGGKDSKVGERLAALESLLDPFAKTANIPAAKRSHRVEAGLRMTLGMAYATWNDPAKAYPQLELALALYQANGGLERADVLAEFVGAALMFEQAGKPDRAAKLYEEILPSVRTQFGSESPDAFTAVHGLARAYSRMGRYAEAVPLLQEVARWRREGTGKHPDVLGSTLDELGECLLKLGKPADAEPIFRERLTLLGANPSVSPLGMKATSQLGASLLGQKKYAEAEKVLFGFFEPYSPDEKFDASLQPFVTEAVDLLVRLYEETNQPTKAASWRKRRPLEPQPNK